MASAAEAGQLDRGGAAAVGDAQGGAHVFVVGLPGQMELARHSQHGRPAPLQDRFDVGPGMETPGGGEDSLVAAAVGVEGREQLALGGPTGPV